MPPKKGRESSIRFLVGGKDCFFSWQDVILKAAATDLF